MRRKINHIKILLLLCILSVAPLAYAQQLVKLLDKRVKSNTLNYEQGLLNNTIKNIITDGQGFLWVATETGLQRFNGYRFESIEPTIDGTSIKLNNSVQLFLLKNKNIWISTKEGVIEFNAITKKFSFVIKLTQTEKDIQILPFYEESGKVWYVEKQKGILLWNTITKQSETVFENMDANFINQLFLTEEVGNSNRLFAPIVHNNNIGYLASLNKIIKINFTTRKYSQLPFSFNTIFSLALQDNDLLVADKTGIHKIEATTESSSLLLDYGQLDKNALVRACLQKTDERFILSVNNNIYEIDKKFSTYANWKTIENKSILNAGFVSNIYADNLNRIWLITNNDLRRIQNTTLPFNHLYYTSAKNNFVKSIVYNENNQQLLAGTFGAGFQLYNKKGEKLLTAPMEKDNNTNAMNIMPLTNDNYLVTPYFNKWYILNTASKSFTPISIPLLTDSFLGSQKVNFVNNIKKITATEFMVSTSKNIFRCTINNTQVTEAIPVFDFLTDSDNYLCFLETNEKTIWTGTRNGLILIKGENGIIKKITNVGNHFIRSLAQDSTGNVWVGTDKGLHIYSSNGDLRKSFYINNGLKNDCIYAILPIEKEAAVFVSTNMGLSQITANGLVKNFSKELGLQDNEFNTGSAYKAMDGQLFFGGINGITAFYPNKLNEFNEKLQIHLSRFVINDSVYNYPSAVWNSDTILLNYQQNHIQFDIVANGVFNPNEYNYQYRIVGFENAWQSTNNPVNIRYTLQPGKYFLEIICTPLLSNNQKFTKTIMLYIKPAWYQRRWVQILLGILALSLVGVFVYQYQRITYLRKIKELQIQNELQKDRDRISRELHDNLGTQLSYISSNADFMIDIDEKLDTKERKRRLGKINETAKESIADLRETIWALKKVNISLDELAQRIKSYALNYQDVFDINFTSEINTIVFLNSSESLHLYRLCQEAITNAAKYAAAKNMYISVTNTANIDYKIVVQDDGIGFDKNLIKNEHYGLENMQSRAKEIKATLVLETDLHVGTTITISK